MKVPKGWELAETGGGCTAFRRELSGGREALITSADDPSAPETPDEQVNLGVYKDGDVVFQSGYLCLRAALRGLRHYLQNRGSR